MVEGRANSKKVVEAQRKQALASARRDKNSLLANDSLRNAQTLPVANDNSYVGGPQSEGVSRPVQNSEIIRPIRTLTPENGRRMQSQQAQAELSALRAQENVQQHLRRNSKPALQRALKDLPECRRSSFIFAYALAAANIYLGMLKTVFLFITDAIIDIIGNISLLFPGLGLIFKGAAELTGLAIGMVIAIAIGMIQFGFATYLFIFIHQRTTIASRKLMNIAIIMLSVLPLFELVPWIFLRLWHIKKEEKENCEKREKILKKLS